MATDYWVLVPKQSEQNVAGVVPDAFVITLPSGSALDEKLLSNYAGQVSANGKTGFQRAGPFTSQAAVDAYLKVGAQNAASPIPGVDITPSGGLTATNPLDALAGIASALRAFYDEVTNVRVWVSLGWLTIGAIMLLSGVWLFASHYGVVPSPAKLGKAALL